MAAKISLEEKIGSILRERGWKLVTAESCTGGLIGHRITNIPGSSDYYQGGIISYSNLAKEHLLHVSHSSLTQFGAVSRQVALEMARGACRALPNGDNEIIIGLAVTGIAGPGGGSPDKPVGLTWIGLATPQGDWAWKSIWKGNRVQNKRSSARKALELLYKYLQRMQCPEPEQYE